MKMTYVSDSIFYTDGENYYCKVYFSPDEIVSLCPRVEHLFVIARIRKINPKESYKLISWSNCSVEFINVEDKNKIKQIRNIFEVSKRLNSISDISYLKFCFISSYIYGLQIKKKHNGKIYFSQMVGDPDCILSFSSSKVKKLLLSALNFFQKKLYSAIAKKMDLQIFVSNKLKEKYAVESVKSIVVNENRFREADIVDLKNAEPNTIGKGLKLVFVGRLSPEKRVQDLLFALKKQSEVSLNIIGDGPQKEELEALTIQLGLNETVAFSGRKEWGDELFSELKRHDILVLPSENEGLPLVIAEAMSCGLPVIASNVGGIPEIVRNEVNGLLFEKGDLNMLEEAINRVKDGEFRLKLASESVKTAHEFSFDNQTKILKNELKKILKEN